jgi:hypothetical protein
MCHRRAVKIFAMGGKRRGASGQIILGAGSASTSTAGRQHRAAESTEHPLGALSEFSSLDPAVKHSIREGQAMVTHTPTRPVRPTPIGGGFRYFGVCGLVLAMVSILIGFDPSAATTRSNIDFSAQIVSRTLKGDRLLVQPQSSAQRVPTPDLKLADGCDPLVSPLMHSELALIAGRCVS